MKWVEIKPPSLVTLLSLFKNKNGFPKGMVCTALGCSKSKTDGKTVPVGTHV